MKKSKSFCMENKQHVQCPECGAPCEVIDRIDRQDGGDGDIFEIEYQEYKFKAQQGAVFVKASERLPKHDGQVHLKVDGLNRIGNFYEAANGKINLHVYGPEPYILLEDKFSGVEWLDESPNELVAENEQLRKELETAQKAAINNSNRFENYRDGSMKERDDLKQENETLHKMVDVANENLEAFAREKIELKAKAEKMERALRVAEKQAIEVQENHFMLMCPNPLYLITEALKEGESNTPLTQERADFIREVNGRDLGGLANQESNTLAEVQEPKWVKGALTWAKETIDFAWDYVKVPESLVETWGNMYMNTMNAIQNALIEIETPNGCKQGKEGQDE